MPTEYAINSAKLRKLLRPDSRSGLKSRPDSESARPDSESARPDSESAKPSVIHHDPFGASPQKFLQELESELAINLNGDSKFILAGINRYKPTDGDGSKFAKWWNTKHYFGKTGQPPTAKQIVQFWPQAFKQKSSAKLKGVRND